MARREKELLARDAKRNVGKELLQAIRDVKARRRGAKYTVQADRIVTASAADADGSGSSHLCLAAALAPGCFSVLVGLAAGRLVELEHETDDAGNQAARTPPSVS